MLFHWSHPPFTWSYAFIRLQYTNHSISGHSLCSFFLVTDCLEACFCFLVYIKRCEFWSWKSIPRSVSLSNVLFLSLLPLMVFLLLLHFLAVLPLFLFPSLSYMLYAYHAVRHLSLIHVHSFFLFSCSTSMSCSLLSPFLCHLHCPALSSDTHIPFPAITADSDYFHHFCSCWKYHVHASSGTSGERHSQLTLACQHRMAEGGSG